MGQERRPTADRRPLQEQEQGPGARGQGLEEERSALEPGTWNLTPLPAVGGRRAVIQAELAWHEQEAHRRYSLDELLYDPPAFDAVVGPAIDFLAAAPGERVLDMGCGEGKETYALAERGLTVISTDLSHVQLARARERVRDALPDARAHFVQANAEELPFAAGAFRVIYGKAILHHLDLNLAAAEVDRLLTQGGRATFAEPLARHPIIVLGRRLTPRLRTRDERPFGLADMDRFAGRFAQRETDAHFLLAPLAYFLRLLPGGEALFRRAHERLAQLDGRLFAQFDALRAFAWYGVVRLRK